MPTNDGAACDKVVISRYPTNKDSGFLTFVMLVDCHGCAVVARGTH